MEISLPTIQDHIPYYLTSSEKDAVTKALKDFPENFDYFLKKDFPNLLQGDCWSRMPRIDPDTERKSEIAGIILSNSCDISSENIRDLPAFLTFAPVILLGQYEGLLESAGVTKDKIQNKLKAIRKQHVTNLIYLPANDVFAESVALLSLTQSVRVSTYEQNTKRQKIFSLSNAGFYLFVLKLSVHYCRFQEAVHRS